MQKYNSVIKTLNYDSPISMLSFPRATRERKRMSLYKLLRKRESSCFQTIYRLNSLTDSMLSRVTLCFLDVSLSFSVFCHILRWLACLTWY